MRHVLQSGRLFELGAAHHERRIVLLVLVLLLLLVVVALAWTAGAAVAGWSAGCSHAAARFDATGNAHVRYIVFFSLWPFSLLYNVITFFVKTLTQTHTHFFMNHSAYVVP